MWFAALDGLIVGVLVALAVLTPFRRAGYGSAANTVTIGLIGGLVGALLGFSLVSGSTSSGPLQPAAIVAGLVGAAVAVAVLRSWVVGDRRSAVAAVAASEAAAAARAEEQRKADKQARREPSKLAELAVLVLTARRWQR